MSDFLSMSDDQILAMGGIAPEPKAEPEKPNAEPEHVEQTPDADTTTAEVDAGAGDEHVQGSGADKTREDAEDEEAEAARARQEAEADAADANATEQTAEDVNSDADGQKPVKPEPKEQAAATNLPEGAERIFESFRANGRDMKVKSVDEAIRLMQMGANYSQKQQANKVNLGYVKVLEQNGLLDHEKLAYLVDLANKKPEAIAKLVKEANFDVHDVDDAAVAQYKAKSLAPSSAQLDLDEVIADIKESKHFDRLVSEMKGWDEKSQALLGSNPASLRHLAEQMDNGVYDKVMDEVNRQQILGQLAGVPVMQAYNEIGQKMAAEGAFNAPAPKGPVKKLVTPGKKASPANPAVEERRRAAAPSKGASTEAEVKKLDFLNMSDEEFAKLTKR